MILKSAAGRSGSVFISSIVALPCQQVSLLKSREGESRKRSEDGGDEAGGAKKLKTKYVSSLCQGPYGALKVLKSLEFDWTKFRALKSLNFTK